jgi:hypothetical protein
MSKTLNVPSAAAVAGAAPCSAFCRCCTCGYQWQRGKDGSHSCSESLLKILNSVRRVATGEDQVADDDTGGLAWMLGFGNRKRELFFGRQKPNKTEPLNNKVSDASDAFSAPLG